MHSITPSTCSSSKRRANDNTLSFSCNSIRLPKSTTIAVSPANRNEHSVIVEARCPIQAPSQAHGMVNKMLRRLERTELQPTAEGLTLTGQDKLELGERTRT